MRKTLVLAGLGAGVLAAVGMFACSDDETSQAKTYNLTLTSAAEVPLCADAGVGATGSATIVVAADNSSITETVTYSGLSGAPFMAHIHSGTPTVAGPIVLPFTVTLTSGFSQVFTAADYAPTGPGAPATFADFVTALRQGNQAYTNLHTDACRPGEIRANIQ